MNRRAATYASEHSTPAKPRPVMYDWCTGEVLPEPDPVRRRATLPGFPAVEVWGDVPPNAEEQPEARMQDPEVQKRLLAEFRSNQGRDPELGNDRKPAALYWDLDLSAALTERDNLYPGGFR